MSQRQRKQSIRLYLNADDYRELLRQASETPELKTPSDYAATLLVQALTQQAGESHSHE